MRAAALELLNKKEKKCIGEPYEEALRTSIAILEDVRWNGWIIQRIFTRICLSWQVASDFSSLISTTRLLTTLQCSWQDHQC